MRVPLKSRNLRRAILGFSLSLLGCAGSTPPVAPAPSPVAQRATPAPKRPAEAALQTPRVRLEADRVLLDDRPVGSLESGKAQTIDSLLEAMKGLQKELHHESHAVPYHLSVAEQVDGARLKSAVQTVAAAGWPVGLLDLGEQSVALHALLPGAPSEPKALSWPNETLLLVVRADSVELFRAHAAAPHATDRSFEDESATRIGTVSADKVTSDVPHLLRSACESGPACSPAALLVADDAPFSVIDGALKALATLPFEHGRADVQLRVRQPESPGTIQPVEGGVGPTLSGRLAPELILQTIRASSDHYRKCYEAGLARDPKLTGRVNVRFVIGRDGKVSHATKGSETTLRDARVTECVVLHFRGLQFPVPEGGSVSVLYPVILAPSE